MKKILLVNEDPKQIEFLKFVISSSGYAVEVVHDPLDLFDLALTAHPDLIITDIHFDYIDGVFMIEKLRSDKDFLKIPVLVLSSKNDPLSMVDSIERGANDFISLPINEDQLIDKIKKLISAA
jgi:PleD family two-component response regulator